MRYVTCWGSFLRYIIIILGYCWFSRGKHSICLFILSIFCKRWCISFRTTQLIEIGAYFTTVWLRFSSTIGCLGLGIIGTPLFPVITSGLIKNGLSAGQKPDVNAEMSFLLTLMRNWNFFIFTGVNCYKQWDYFLRWTTKLLIKIFIHFILCKLTSIKTFFLQMDLLSICVCFPTILVCFVVS